MKDYSVSLTLIGWYEQYKRELPWRETSNPYLIWISEIILQQTRVNQGLEYYIRFVNRFPDVLSLAMAEEDEVLKYWQGLGYYSRARNLHKAARQIQSQYKGKFPQLYEEVLSLAGIGEYTAAAICSFAYGIPKAVVDGNVYRFISRLYGIETPIDSTEGKKTFAALAQDLLHPDQPAAHNQAMMEFGALQCVPVSPDCANCLFMNQCQAYALNIVPQLPVKAKKTATKNRFFNYFYVIKGDNTYLRKRIEKDVWRNLFEFPLIETTEHCPVEDVISGNAFHALFEGCEPKEIVQITHPMKHVLSHRVIYARFITIRIPENSSLHGEQFIEIPQQELSRYAVSRLMDVFLDTVELP